MSNDAHIRQIAGEHWSEYTDTELRALRAAYNAGMDEALRAWERANETLQRAARNAHGQRPRKRKVRTP